MNRRQKFLALILSIALLLGMTGCLMPSQEQPAPKTAISITEDGLYTSKEEVALYLKTYEKLPDNYITKAEAQRLGWKQKGTLDEVAPGKSIGGDRFGNYEAKLPKEKGRTYYECDIDYEQGNRNGKRLVYSDDGNIYYTGDHYNTFEHLYGDDQ